MKWASKDTLVLTETSEGGTARAQRSAQEKDAISQAGEDESLYEDEVARGGHTRDQWSSHERHNAVDASP